MNIKIGPMIQFSSKDNPNTLWFLNTLPNSSYLTLVRGGYIITIKPMAMGIDVVSIDRLFKRSVNPE